MFHNDRCWLHNAPTTGNDLYGSKGGVTSVPIRTKGRKKRKSPILHILPLPVNPLTTTYFFRKTFDGVDESLDDVSDGGVALQDVSELLHAVGDGVHDLILHLVEHLGRPLYLLHVVLLKQCNSDDSNGDDSNGDNGVVIVTVIMGVITVTVIMGVMIVTVTMRVMIVTVIMGVMVIRVIMGVMIVTVIMGVTVITVIMGVLIVDSNGDNGVMTVTVIMGVVIVTVIMGVVMIMGVVIVTVIMGVMIVTVIMGVMIVTVIMG